MDKPFFPDGEQQRYILQTLVHHTYPTHTTIAAIIGTDPVPHIEAMKRRGLKLSRHRGLYSMDDDMRRRVLAGLQISAV